jgi:type II secretory pathway pseudopilin PulG
VTNKSPLSSETLGALIVVGVIASLFIAYLVYEWLKQRQAARKLDLRRQQAREAWQQELQERKSHAQKPG